MSEHEDLVFHTIGPEAAGDPDSPEAARVHGFAEAVSRAFLDARRSEEWHRRWREHLRADSLTLRGAWPAAPALASRDLPVATFIGWDARLNVGGARLLPVHLISDVTVSPDHRRRGLTRRLMSEDLASAAARGVPLAALTVSEAGIYGRFGFGAATAVRHVDVDVSGSFALRAEVDASLGADPGRIEVVEPDAAWPAVSAVLGAVLAGTRGAVQRPQFYEPMMRGTFGFDTDGPDPKLRAAVHLDEAGEPDGYLLWRPAGEVDGLETIDVTDLHARTDATYLRLWRFVASMDLVDRVRWRHAPVTDPLEHALVDARLVRTTRVRDLLWGRVLDPVTALEARPWSADGAVVLGVDDPLGHAAGAWRVEVSDGAARVARSGAEADVLLGADTLGSLYLGGSRVETLAAAQRVRGDAGAIARFAAMADGGPAPWCTTAF